MLSFLVLAAALNSAPCVDTSPIPVNDCLVARLKESEVILDRYFQTAKKLIDKESFGEFTQAQQSWLKYRDAECGALFDHWSSGTIRVPMELQCRIRLPRFRTFTIWRDWLTPVERSPPVLPRPELETVIHER
jgi:uncharacterized protein YecT (DUF1311 family)